MIESFACVYNIKTLNERKHGKTGKKACSLPAVHNHSLETEKTDIQGSFHFRYSVNPTMGKADMRL
jgi:hypothetical protein